MAAKTSTRPSSAGTGGAEPRQRSGAAAIGLTGLGVLIIAAFAVLLSYNGIYQVALQGNVEPRYAHLYPAGFTLLLLMSFWTSYLLRAAPRRRRIWVDVLILALILVAAGASVLQATDHHLAWRIAVVVTAAAPWLALLVAFRIFLWVLMYLRGEVTTAQERGREPVPAQDGDGQSDDQDRDIVPMSEPEPPERGESDPPRTDGAAEADTAPIPEARDAGDRGTGSDEGVEVVPPRSAPDGPAPETGGAETDLREASPAETAPAEVSDPSPVSSVGQPPEPVAAGTEDTQAAGGTEAAEAEDTAGAAPEATTAGAPVPDAEPLPKRTPQQAAHPGHAGVPPEPEAETDGQAPHGADPVPDGSAAADEGFVHDPPPADPTSDEADITAGDATPGTPENADGAPEPAGEPEPDGEASSGAEERVSAGIGTRPVTRKPPRPPMPDFPEEPPSGRVRSGPTPPAE
ncbi:hypothetical protein FHX37_4331 [Haloactinospora alba]|uniref:DUF2637 domain-containing protein n=1 Tax=Haloactinospora alba TaxID=405555 RepID=A0A543N6Z7_9ACTN|nr:hypothetical protein [Haloactinospora alba]TQN27609.1 hypothetical protein FHX37_4331 [Haloactinospora alba]